MRLRFGVSLTESQGQMERQREAQRALWKGQALKPFAGPETTASSKSPSEQHWSSPNPQLLSPLLVSLLVLLVLRIVNLRCAMQTQRHMARVNKMPCHRWAQCTFPPLWLINVCCLRHVQVEADFSVRGTHFIHFKLCRSHAGWQELKLTSSMSLSRVTAILQVTAKPPVLHMKSLVKDWEQVVKIAECNK